MNPTQLLRVATEFGTPLYAYDLTSIVERTRLLRSLFSNRFDVSYAIKANPNAGLLQALRPEIATFDASSFGEVQRALRAGMPAERISFSGPAKRSYEINGAIDLNVGELVIESLPEAVEASRYAQKIGRRQPCLVRINPLKVPRKFGASMAGSASQFGIDEEDIATVLPQIRGLPGLELIGFHIYSGTNCLDPKAIAENFAIFSEIFQTAQAVTGIEIRRLIFGSGFGVPYLPDETPLDHAALPELINPIVDDLLAKPQFTAAQCNLELGRWLVAPFGWMLTSVISEKRSRGSDIRTCDAGFNNHLAACGMMGSVFRRNWVYKNLSNPDGPAENYTLVGPLCTSIDRLAVDVEIPKPRIGDVIAVENSGAYGLTASPVRFISHPEPREVILLDGVYEDVSETERYPLVARPVS